jgi:hypothetical protein
MQGSGVVGCDLVQSVRKQFHGFHRQSSEMELGVS